MAEPPQDAPEWLQGEEYPEEYYEEGEEEGEYPAEEEQQEDPELIAKMRAFEEITKPITPPPSITDLEEEAFERRIAEEAARLEEAAHLEELLEQQRLVAAMRESEEQEEQQQRYPDPTYTRSSYSSDSDEDIPEELEEGESLLSESTAGLTSAIREMLPAEVVGSVQRPQSGSISKNARKQWFSQTNANALSVMSHVAREQCLREGSRALSLRHGEEFCVDGFFVYPNTQTNLDSSRPYSTMPKLAGYTAVVRDQCPAIHLLALARFEITDRILVPINQPTPAQLSGLDATFVRWFETHAEAKIIRHEFESMLEAVRQLHAKYSVAHSSDKSHELSFAHLNHSPLEVQVVSRNRMTAGTDRTITEYYAYVELLDCRGIKKLALHRPPERDGILTTGDLRANHQGMLSSHEEMYNEALAICVGLGLTPNDRTRPSWDSNCRIVFGEPDRTIVRNHAVQWSPAHNTHFYPITTQGSRVRNLVAVTSAAGPLDPENSDTDPATERSLASIPFTLMTSEHAEAFEDVSTFTYIRDTVRQVHAPYFPDDHDGKDASTTYIRNHVMSATTREYYLIHRILSIGRPTLEVNVSEAQQLLPNGFVPYNNPHFADLVLKEIAQLFACKTTPPHKKMARIGELIGYGDTPQESRPYFHVAVVAESPLLLEYPK